MKLFGSLIGIYLIISLVSCGEDEAKENEAELLGTWQSTDLIIRGCEDENDNRMTSVECPGEDCLRYTFAIEDSTKTRMFIQERVLEDGSRFETGTFSVGETRIELCSDDEDGWICDTYKFNVSSTMLVLLSEDADLNCTREIKFIREEEKAEEEE